MITKENIKKKELKLFGREIKEDESTSVYSATWNLTTGEVKEHEPSIIYFNDYSVYNALPPPAKCEEIAKRLFIWLLKYRRGYVK
ncbi:MAG: hypothetical protein N2V78_09090 [Methanophagales archaeon]|nr:hypothetical protein [Methanophagales archaeon]